MKVFSSTDHLIIYLALPSLRGSSISSTMNSSFKSGTTSPTPSNNSPPLVEFKCPTRPNHGQEGRPILLRANHFQVRMPKGYIHHYDVSITPDKCPRRVNR